MIPDKHPLQLTYNDLEQILVQHDIRWEMTKVCGYIDYHEQIIGINPMLDYIASEIAVHEALHYYCEQYTKKGATEVFIKHTARHLVKDEELSQKVNKYIEKYAKKVPHTGTPL